MTHSSDDRCHFFARITISRDSVDDIAVWVHELDPIGLGRRPGEDWVREHLVMYTDADWREFVADHKTAGAATPIPDNLQILIKGSLRGWVDINGEGDEEMDITDLEFAQMPNPEVVE
jgi:hypothetical protein